MTIAKCSEQAHNPPKIGFELFSGATGQMPTIEFLLPIDCHPSDYDGEGIFIIDLETLLKNTLAEHLDFDEGAGTYKLTALLRQYADRLDESARVYRSKAEL
jgi:hypothetical protein